MIGYEEVNQAFDLARRFVQAVEKIADGIEAHAKATEAVAEQIRSHASSVGDIGPAIGQHAVETGGIAQALSGGLSEIESAMAAANGMSREGGY